ncbi:MAG: acyl-CoA dehydrogenase family protein [Vicinamibacterales bacterium]
MDFDWAADEIELIARVRDFAARELRRPCADRDRDAVFGRDEWSACGAYGLLGLPVPPEYGGAGRGRLLTARILEALGELSTDRGLLFSAAAHMCACLVPIWQHGAPEQKDAWLPRLCRGEWIGANAITEAGAGSDIFALRTTAVRRGDGYLLDGEKSFVSNAPVADVFLVYASTDPSLGALGLSAFVVPRSTPGLTVLPAFRTIGLRTTPIAAVTFNGCTVPAGHRLGAEGDGKAAFETSMAWERLCLFGIWLGLMQAQLDQTLTHANGRRQFGRPIGKNQAISHRIADMKLRLEAARWMLYRACWLADRGRSTTLDVSLAKLAVSEAAIQSSLDTIQIHGAAGVVTDTGLEQALRDAIPGTIYSGTSEMHREIVARSLGL